MSHPKRIQRKRTKGWKMPEGAVYVGRPTKWGNPFWHTQRFYGLEACLALYENAVRGAWSPSVAEQFGVANITIPYTAQHDWRQRFSSHPLEELRELRGKNLACWCPLDQPCHADVLLALANEPEAL